MRGFVVSLLSVLTLTGGLVAIQPVAETALEPLDRVVNVGGGTISYSSALHPGARFGQAVALPEHLANPYQADPDDEQPGDGHDDETLILQRRHTDHSWWEKPLTGRVEIANVHGTPTNPVCICDTEFVLGNESGSPPGTAVVILDSSYILFDNVTVYGGGIAPRSTDHITFSRSQFINAFIDAERANHGLVWDSDFIELEGIQSIPRSDPITENPTGIDECWPNPSCQGSGVDIFTPASDWTFKWNYFNGGGISGFGGGVGIQVEHNTFLHPDELRNGFWGENTFRWNLVRGHGNGGTDLGGNAVVENNSIVLAFEPYPLSEVVLQEYGFWVRTPGTVVMKNNDLVGYGTKIPVFVSKGGAPALYNQAGTVMANGNYWGTVHDPKLPEDRWIRTDPGATTVVDDWFVEPIHEVTPLALDVNPQDAHRWMEEAPKRIQEFIEDETPRSAP